MNTPGGIYPTDSSHSFDPYHPCKELRQLGHFVAVAEERHFTRAARRVPLVESSLSSARSELERELGAELVVRSSRRVELTEAGRALPPATAPRSGCAAARPARST
jgi:hypothetical protein